MRDWDEFARKNPEAPLTQGERVEYMNHVLDGWDNRARYLKEMAAWEQLPWWKRWFTPRPREN